MANVRSIILLVIIVVLAVSMGIEAIWDSVYSSDGALDCFAYNTSSDMKDCKGNTCTGRATCCVKCVNGTTFTITKLVPMMFVGAFVIGTALLAYSKYS